MQKTSAWKLIHIPVDSHHKAEHAEPVSRPGRRSTLASIGLTTAVLFVFLIALYLWLLSPLT